MRGMNWPATAGTIPAPTRRRPRRFAPISGAPGPCWRISAASAVTGYRAATFSINRRNMWAFPILRQEGYVYSSSINPIRHDLYGMPDAPRVPFRPHADGVLEIPMTTVRLLGRNWPCSGGGYFRLLPTGLYRAGLRAGEPARRPAGRVLLPSVGDRCRAAAGARRAAEVPPAALHQPVADEGRSGAAAAGFSVGPDGPGLCSDADRHAAERFRPSHGRASLRPLEDASEAAWDRFVLAMPCGHASFTAPAGRGWWKPPSATPRTTPSPSATAPSPACCRWPG